MEVKTEVNLSAKVQQFSAFQSCVDELVKNTVELKKRIALLQAQLPPEKVGRAQGDAPHRPHEDKIAFSNMKSSEGFGLIHTPVHDYNKNP